MKADDREAETVEEYIARFPPEVRRKLEALRAAIREAAPDATEKIAYRMPAYLQDGPLVYFAAFREHIGLYPFPDALGTFAERLAPYPQGKGSVRFPLTGDPPYDLVKEIVRFRVAENAKKSAGKKRGSRRR